MSSPRQLQLDHIPTVDAVFRMHEHDDHFDVPSLELLDRKIPIFLSSRSSMAGYKILGVMGFPAQQLVLGVSLRSSQIELLAL